MYKNSVLGGAKFNSCFKFLRFNFTLTMLKSGQTEFFIRTSTAGSFLLVFICEFSIQGHKFTANYSGYSRLSSKSSSNFGSASSDVCGA